MLDRYFGLIEAAVFYVAVFGLCVWQLVSLNRDVRARRAHEDREKHKDRPGASN